MFLKLPTFCLCFVCFFEIYCMGEINTDSSQSDNKSLQLYETGNNQLTSSQTTSLTKSKTYTAKVKSHIFEISDNTTFRIKRKRKKKHKKKRANNKNVNDIVEQDSFTPNSLTKDVTYAIDESKPNEIKKKKKKRRKRKRKLRKKQDNIPEVMSTNSVTVQTRENPINGSFASAIISPEGGSLNITQQPILPPKTPKTATNLTYMKSADFVKQKNRCNTNNGGCSQICQTKGKIKCGCLKGYVLAKNHKKCVDIDECRKKNGGCKEICRNIPGAYYCDCPIGLRISDDLMSCEDINECHLRNGHGPCQDTCTNTYGSYFCDCSHLNGSRLAGDRHSCDDINECEEANPECSHLCLNTRVGAFCSCPDGMELMSDYKTCQDIDECEDTSIKSSCKRGCVNVVGSYYCEENFQSDQNLSSTKVPTCPPLNPPKYGYISCLRNNSLPYDTYTKNGRRIIKNSPGTKCHLECPVGFKLLGTGKFVCSVSGKWIIKGKGACIKSSHPKLECPPDQTIFLTKKRRTTSVTFPRPQTNIRWKIVKSYPEWAKNLKGKLGEGHHAIQFSVTDPSSKLSSTCSFFITVKK